MPFSYLNIGAARDPVGRTKGKMMEIPSVLWSEMLTRRERLGYQPSFLRETTVHSTIINSD